MACKLLEKIQQAAPRFIFTFHSDASVFRWLELPRREWQKKKKNISRRSFWQINKFRNYEAHEQSKR